MKPANDIRRCRICGCTDDHCAGCIDRTTVHALDYPPVTLHISFEDLLGRDCHAMPESTRRERWNAWKALDAEAAAYWEPSACAGCGHLLGDWCVLMGLPASVNPVLSIRAGMIGMACMGMVENNAPLEGSERSDDPLRGVFGQDMEVRT